MGWRFVLGAVRTHVRVASPTSAVDVVRGAVAAAGDAVRSLSMDLRLDGVTLTLQSPATGWVSTAEIEAAGRISAAAATLGLSTDPGVGDESGRSVQALEFAIDALDIAAVLPFWKAVLGYADEPGASDPADAVVDPLGQGPTVWFQQMDVPRPQRNRIHFDLAVPHDEASRRIAAALAAGGRLLSDAEAPAFWVLADVEGNEVCVTTWQGRD